MSTTVKNPKTIITAIAFLVILGVIYAISGSIFETNNSGYYKVKQAAISGTLSVHSSPGMFMQMFGIITEYPNTGDFHFSTSDLDGGSGAESRAIQVRFNDGSIAKVSGSLKFKLPLDDDARKFAHEDYRSYQKIAMELVRQTVNECLIQSANIMTAEEAYSSRRGEFTSIAEGMITKGLFKKTSKEVQRIDALDSTTFIDRFVEVDLDENGNPIINKISPFATYGITVVQFVIKNIDFDETIDALISKKKEAEQQKVVARANAERAKQDAITAEEEGKARIAIAKANEEVEKIKAVTQAEKEYEVARLNKLRSQEEAKSVRIKGEADAAIARLKVSAGLTPLERANIDKEVAIGVAREMAKIKFPQMMILGGGGNGKSALNPFDAVGLESFIRLNKSIAKGTGGQ
ncbi:MAG: regulator of protease activity HflC (stomatin/prohibitin superfamily) [Arenicella sp.]|jgi:regulator of protease activity HflC (stomatin/prohibitin superfamily)